MIVVRAKKFAKVHFFFEICKNFCNFAADYYEFVYYN